MTGTNPDTPPPSAGEVDVVLTTDADGIRTFTLNRPERANAWTMEMEELYFQGLVTAANDPSVRVLVVTGAGTTFCPGMDASALKSVSEGGEFSQAGRVRQTLPLAIPKPLIAAVNGGCAGIGLVQALMADVRITSTSAKFSTAFSRRGLPAENAVAWLLARLVGQGVAADLLLSGRTILASEAHELGLVNRVVDPQDLTSAVTGYAGEMASACSPAAMADIKAQLYGSFDMSIEQARREAKQVFAAAREREDFREGVASLLGKRQPRFAGLPPAGLSADNFRD